MDEEKRRFPYPEELETPPGTEGWEEIYPYYFLPNTEIDKEDFYFLDISHIPEPIPPFDAFSPESWLRHIGQYNSRMQQEHFLHKMSPLRCAGHSTQDICLWVHNGDLGRRRGGLSIWQQ